MTWLVIGLISGAALALLADHTRMRRWQRQAAYQAHVQAVANRRQLGDALANARLDVVIERSRGRRS